MGDAIQIETTKEMAQRETDALFARLGVKR